VSVDQPGAVAAAAERLRAETTISGLLGTTALTYVELLGAPACTISRVIGDLLVDLTQHKQAGKPDRLGHGYLISDYPLTGEVITTREPRTVFRGDPDADPAEVRLLEELGFDSLLMLPIEGETEVWGLIEVYGEKGRQFTEADVGLGRDVAAEVSEVLARLGRST
jgi:GAF domain-containing protein